MLQFCEREALYFERLAIALGKAIQCSESDFSALLPDSMPVDRLFRQAQRHALVFRGLKGRRDCLAVMVIWLKPGELAEDWGSCAPDWLSWAKRTTVFVEASSADSETSLLVNWSFSVCARARPWFGYYCCRI
jgi:hypothetical protein